MAQTSSTSLNPYSNGSTTLTFIFISDKATPICLNPYSNGSTTLTCRCNKRHGKTIGSLNPYSNGSTTLTANCCRFISKKTCLNPYSNGSTTLTVLFVISMIINDLCVVQILL